MELTWERRHTSATGWLAYEGRFIRGQVAMYDVADEQHRTTGELSSSATSPVSPTPSLAPVQTAAARRQVEEVFRLRHGTRN